MEKHKVVVSSESLGVPDVFTDPTEVILSLWGKDESFWSLIDDLRKAGVSFDALDRSSFEILKALGAECRLIRIDDKPMDKKAIYSFAEQGSWVVGNGLVHLTNEKGLARLFVCRDKPQVPEHFQHIIEVCVEGTESPAAYIKVDGVENSARISCKDRRFDADLTKLINKSARLPKGNSAADLKQSCVIIPDTKSGMITIKDELRWAKSRLEHIRGSTRVDARGSLEHSILNILLNHCEPRVEISEQARANLRNRIKASVLVGKPIPISITIANGMRCPHPLKNTEPFGLPTFAWFYNLLELASMQLKTRLRYVPGLHFYLFEEGYLFHEMLGVPKEVVERNKQFVEKLIRELQTAVELPITIIPLLPEQFPSEEVAAIRVSPTDPEIFAMLCSLPEMTSTEILDWLYTVRNKPFPEIRGKVGKLWEASRDLVIRKNRFLIYRKQSGLFYRLLHETTGENPENRLLDAAITEKEGRLSFKMTQGAMFNHGASVVDRDASGKCSCVIVPEYRLEKGFYRDQARVVKVKPVKIDPRELGVLGPPYTWYYEVIR